MLLLSQESQEVLSRHDGFQILIKITELKLCVFFEDSFELVAATGYLVVRVDLLMREESV
jgi:hypothetical protein